MNVKRYLPWLFALLSLPGLIFTGWQAWTLYRQHTALWQWANGVHSKIVQMEQKLTGFKPGDPLPPGAFYEDGEKWGFPKGTKVTVMPPSNNPERKPGKK